MKLHHIAIWTFRLEELKEFYVRFFGGKSNEKYINPKKGFESYFISFGEGTDLELMSRTEQGWTDTLCFHLSQPGRSITLHRTNAFGRIYHRRRTAYFGRRIL